MAPNQEDNVGPLSRTFVTGVWPSRDARVQAADCSGFAAESWAGVPEAFRAGTALPSPWEALFAPLRNGAIDDLVVVGQIGQSLDGRTATSSGHSHYINCAEGLDHLHRLRALVDAVVVGVGTVTADNPQMTVRRVAGPSPARVVIDPHGRLPRESRMLEGNVRRIVVTRDGARAPLPNGVERITLPAGDGQIAPAAILAALAECGFRRIMIEGGANTVSRFITARCMDRLHIMVAPLILGDGPSALALAPLQRVDDAVRPPVRAFPLGVDVLFDCDLAAHRTPIGRANKST
jgi:diaminohydroxyphosphoribosylaminopyrimidine deaminase/5-amino-6-(5-phosphoribosylamino)uracil reductase